MYIWLYIKSLLRCGTHDWYTILEIYIRTSPETWNTSNRTTRLSEVVEVNRFTHKNVEVRWPCYTVKTFTVTQLGEWTLVSGSIVITCLLQQLSSVIFYFQNQGSTLCGCILGLTKFRLMYCTIMNIQKPKYLKMTHTIFLFLYFYMTLEGL